MLKLIEPRKGKSPYWSVRGSYLGQSVDRSTKTPQKQIARRVLRKIELEIERGEFARPGEPTFLSASVDYMKAGGERRFIQPLLDHFKDRPLKLIDQAAIDNAALTIYPNASPATRNRQVHCIVSAILKKGGVKHKLERPRGSAGNRKTDWLWPEQAFRLFTEADKIDAEFGVFLRFLCYTGMRLGEGLGLRTDMTRLAESFAYVAKTKNDNPRPVFLPPILVAALANHPRGMDRPGERVFRFAKCGRLYEMLRIAAKQADVPLPRRQAFHLMRHTWATWMRRYGGLDTKGLVGTGVWRDERSASRYEHVIASEEAMRAVRLPTENEAAFLGLSLEKRRNG